VISCYLQGGLGNQMFQVATTLATAKEYGYYPVFNFEKMCLSTCKIHSIDGGNKYYKENIFSKLNYSEEIEISKIYYEPSFNYRKIPRQDNVALHGYFQSEKYFKNHQKLIRETFDVRDEEIINTAYDKLMIDIDTVSIHVRRNDYLKLKDHHPMCPISYYKKASQIFNNSLFLVFSDDIAWCKQQFHFLSKVKYIENLTSVQSLLLMSRCDHNIIANSSFSWWAAWLNKNKEKKVIAPINWFGPRVSHDISDLLPKEWIVK
jgi:hypothetical protein